MGILKLQYWKILKTTELYSVVSVVLNSIVQVHVPGTVPVSQLLVQKLPIKNTCMVFKPAETIWSNGIKKDDVKGFLSQHLCHISDADRTLNKIAYVVRQRTNRIHLTRRKLQYGTGTLR
jgi:(2Fe-2S) ferredoxin